MEVIPMQTPLFAPVGFEPGNVPPGPIMPEGMVEIGLLLPTKRAEALLKLAKERRESVGQILRRMIERGLNEMQEGQDF